MKQLALVTALTLAVAVTTPLGVATRAPLSDLESLRVEQLIVREQERAVKLRQIAELEEELRPYQEYTKLPMFLLRHIKATAESGGLPLDEIISIIAQETGGTFNVQLVHHNTNGTTDYGLMQLNDGGTLQWLAKVTNTPQEPFNPYYNTTMGIWYLAHLYDDCAGSIDCTRSRYNGDSRGVYTVAVSRQMDRLRQSIKKPHTN